jgi:trigger factor
MEKDEVKSQYAKILADYLKSAQIPGFRRGKVPQNVLEQKLGKALKQEVLEQIVEHTLSDLFESEDFPQENKPLPYSTPIIDGDLTLEPDSDLDFSVTYDVMPQFSVEKYQGFEITVPSVHIEQEDIDRELGIIRDRNAVVIDKTDDSPASINDVITVTYCELDETDSPITGTERKDFVFTLGSDYNPYHFDEDIVGMKKGETKVVEKQRTEEKAIKVKITVTDLKEKRLPDLNDEFAQDINEKYTTLEDLKQDIYKHLEEEIINHMKRLKINRVFEKIMEQTPIDIPESMIRIQLDAKQREFMRTQGIPSDQIPPLDDKTYQMLTELWRPGVIKTLHSGLLADSLARSLGLNVSDEEINNKLKEIAVQTNTSEEEVVNYYAQESRRKLLIDEIKERKLFDTLLVENTFNIGEKSSYFDLIGEKV